jgi:hypothetical protein
MPALAIIECLLDGLETRQREAQIENAAGAGGATGSLHGRKVAAATGRADLQRGRHARVPDGQLAWPYAPKDVPPEILAKLREAVAAALEHPLVQTRFPEIGGIIPKKEDRGGDHSLRCQARRCPLGRGSEQSRRCRRAVVGWQ